MPVWVAHTPKQRYWLHGLLLVLTCFTTLVVGARMQFNFAQHHPALFLGEGSVELFPADWVFSHPERLLGGLPFAATVMFFFLSHEMGHYLYCRRYGIYATLPFFIPMPTLIGTMGAVILIRSPIRSRTALFDIGIAGPIAGFLVALTALAVSLSWSQPLQSPIDSGELELGYPLIFRLVQRGLALMHPASPIASLPLNRLLLHPVAIAAWVGMLATALNLLPGGQLDGGHILYSISPRVHRFVSRATILILLPMAYFFWTGWLLWAVLLQLSSLRHPQVAEWPLVKGGRLWLAFLALLMLVLTFTPAPIGSHAFPETVRDLLLVVRDLSQYLRDWLQHWRGR
jgi:membrane-associated protease RseP (regulator of RpoE activity)